MNLSLPPQRDLPRPQQMLDAILDSSEPLPVDSQQRPPRRRLIGVLIVIALVAVAAIGWNQLAGGNSEPPQWGSPTGGASGMVALCQAPEPQLDASVIDRYRLAGAGNDQQIVDATADGAMVVRWGNELRYLTPGADQATVIAKFVGEYPSGYSNDGQTFVFNTGDNDGALTRWRWQPGMAAPEELEHQPLTVRWSQLTDAIVQHDGYSIWLSRNAQTNPELMIRGRSGAVTTSSSEGPNAAVGFAAQGDFVWVLNGDGSLVAHPLVASATEVPQISTPGVRELISDGQTLVLVTDDGLEAHLADGTVQHYPLTTTDPQASMPPQFGWQLSGDYLTWIQRADDSSSDPTIEMLQLSTGTMWTMPNAVLHGVRNGHYLWYDQTGPALVPISEMALPACADEPSVPASSTAAGPASSAISIPDAVVPCWVDIPNQWRPLADQYRMSPGSGDTVSIWIHAIGDGGHLLTERFVTADHAIVEYGLPDGSDTVQVLELATGSTLRSASTDGESFLFINLETPSPQRMVWRPGDAAPQQLEQIDSLASPVEVWSQLALQQAQHAGRSIWFTPDADGNPMLVIQNADGERVTAAAGAARQLAAQGDQVWVLLADGTLQAHDLITGQPTGLTQRFDRVRAIVSDGVTLAVATADRLVILGPDGSESTFAGDALEPNGAWLNSFAWQLSDRYLAWNNNRGAARLLDFETGSVTTLPMAGTELLLDGYLITETSENSGSPSYYSPVVPLSVLQQLPRC